MSINKPTRAKFQSIHLEITNSCNFSCDFCASEIQTREKVFMETSVAKNIISEIAESNLSKCLTFHIMGEPLLHKDIVELCQYAEDLGITVLLFTNGTLLNEELNKSLFSTGLSRMEISLRTPNDLAFNKRSNPRDLSFGEYKNKIKELLSNKMEAQNNTKIVINFFKQAFLFNLLSGIKSDHLTNPEDNLSVMKEFQQYCLTKAKQMGKNISKYENIKLKPSLNQVEIFENIFFSAHRLSSFFLTENMKTSSYSQAFFGKCDTFRRFFAILSNGSVTTCCLDYNGENIIGNIHDQKLMNILKLEKIKDIRNHFDRYRPATELCKRCLGSPNLIFSIAKQLYSVATVSFKPEKF